MNAVAVVENSHIRIEDGILRPLRNATNGAVIKWFPERPKDIKKLDREFFPFLYPSYYLGSCTSVLNSSGIVDQIKSVIVAIFPCVVIPEHATIDECSLTLKKLLGLRFQRSNPGGLRLFV